MKQSQKNIVRSMVKALQKFEECQAKMTDEGWREVCDAIGEAHGYLPTWNEISAFKDTLEKSIA